MEYLIIGALFLIGAGPSAWRIIQALRGRDPYKDFEHPEAR